MKAQKFFVSAIAIPIAITTAALLQQSLSITALAQNIEDFPNNAQPVSPENDIFNNPNTSIPNGGNPVNSNNISITRGSGRITNSQYPAVVPVGTSVSQVSGAYNPSTGKILLEIEGRQAEISLNAPLRDGTPIPFTVSRSIPRDATDSSSRLSASKFTALVKNAWIKDGIQTQGTLIKQGNQIQGKFASQARWRPFNARFSEVKTATDGAVEGEFVLTLQPGVTANTPTLRNYAPGTWEETAVRGGW